MLYTIIILKKIRRFNMEVSDFKRYNLNYLAIIIGIIFIFRSIIISLSFNQITNSYLLKIIAIIVASLIAVLGIILFNKDYKITLALYIIAIIGLILGHYTGIYPFVFFALALILAYYEKDKSDNTNLIDSDSHFFGDEPKEIKKVPEKNLKLIPIVSLILIILLSLSITVVSDMEVNDRANAINITDLNAVTASEYGYPQVNITGKLTSSETFDSVSVKTYWYDELGTQISETYDSGIKSEIKKNQTYQLDSHYYGQKDAKMPIKAEIVVKDLKHDQIVYSKNVTY